MNLLKFLQIKNIFPAAQVYKEILRRGINPEKIIVMGDSAVGNLTLSLAVYLKENKIPQPKLLILMLAWGSVENKLPSRKYNFFDKRNPNLSPIYADFKGFPAIKYFCIKKARAEKLCRLKKFQSSKKF